MSSPRWMDASEAEPDQLYVVASGSLEEDRLCYLDGDAGWLREGEPVEVAGYAYRVYGPIPIDEEERIEVAVEKTVACCPDDLGHVPGPGRKI